MWLYVDGGFAGPQPGQQWREGCLDVDVKGIPWVTYGTILHDLSRGYLMGQFYVSRPLNTPMNTPMESF